MIIATPRHVRPLLHSRSLQNCARLSLKAFVARSQLQGKSNHRSLYYSSSPVLFRGETPFGSTSVLTRSFRPSSKTLNAIAGLNESSEQHLKVSDANGGTANKTPSSMQPGHSGLKWDIPQRVREKVISAEDAVALVQDGDTVAVSGFVCQGAPEALLKALGDRFQKHQEPRDLTVLFGGGPGDYGERGLSHLAKVTEDGKTQMLKRTIGG